MKTRGFIFLLVAALMLTQIALAKGLPQKVTISSPELAEEIEITGDEATLSALGTMMLEDYTTISDDAPQAISGEGYLITRYFEDSLNPRREYIPFDQLRYTPDAEGGRGSIHYIGIVNGSSEYDGKWFRANAANEAVLLSVINGTDTEAAAPFPRFDAFFQAFALFLTSS